MTTDTDESKVSDDATPQDPANAAVGDSGDDSGEVKVGPPEFQEIANSQDGESGAADLNRFQDIKVTVSADLGRAEVPIQFLMGLSQGSVLELNREIDSPVELVAQGVPLACGEVVVVNGCFAIRVTQVYQGKQS